MITSFFKKKTHIVYVHVHCMYTYTFLRLFTSKNWNSFPDTKRSQRGELTDSHLHEEQRQCGEHEHARVRDEKRPSAVDVGAIWKTPDASETNSVADGREKEVEIATPVSTFLVLIAA